MSMWTEDQFASRAKDLARAHVGSKTPLNDLVEKVAREAELTPDAIRTLGRLTNVAVFQEMFQQKAASSEADRVVEFEPGDPEVVIQRVVKSAEIQAAAAPPAEKVAAELPDLMRSERGFATELTKEAAHDEPTERSAPRNLEVMRLRKMADELAVMSQMTAQRWEDGLSKLAHAFRKAPGYGPSFTEFEKAAFAEHGYAALVELTTLREDLRLPPVSVSREKVAALKEYSTHTDTAELGIFRQVFAQREQYEILKLAQEQVAARLRS